MVAIVDSAVSSTEVAINAAPSHETSGKAKARATQKQSSTAISPPNSDGRRYVQM